ncbi:hypothetical protein GE09DRAFT_17565 [Coniochaeta sp. 2T2.1]|nr:hypothetical protein GE09DRAFT_17565 [Coniochaeta sp. 2T2.1]
MLTHALLLATAYTAMASPLSTRDAYPPTGLSQGFKLILNVTHLPSDFAETPVHGLELTSIHVGAGINAPVPVESGSAYFASNGGTIQEDINAANPYGFEISDLPEEDAPGLYDLHVNIGSGEQGFAVSGGACPALRAPSPGVFVVCDQGFEVYAHPKLVLKFVAGRVAVPANCTVVELLPQCAGLSGGESNTGAGPESSCYAGVVADVDWSKATAC